MPPFTETVVAGETQARVELGAEGHGQYEVRAAYVADVFRSGKQRGQHDAARVHARRIVLIVEVERVRCSPVRHGRTRWSIRPLADQSCRRAGLLPACEARVERRNAGRVT